MNTRLIVAWMLLFGTVQLNAQDWSSWAATNNRDFQYRWLASANSGECQLQLHDLKRQPNETTVVSVLVDYKSGQAESMRDVITIMGSSDENQGPLIVSPCASVGGVHVNDMVRCGTSGCKGSNWIWL
jgi:hypothetical protein